MCRTPQAAAGTLLHFSTTASGAVKWAKASERDVNAANSSSTPDKPSKGGDEPGWGLQLGLQEGGRGLRW